MSAGSQAHVTAQYERFPYPVRYPDDERKRIIGASGGFNCAARRWARADVCARANPTPSSERS